MAERIERSRTTKETDISVSLDLDSTEERGIGSGVPFLDHMLRAFSFHGGFSLEIRATGDLGVDPHHTVEDIGLVLGDVLSEAANRRTPLTRYGHAVIPMDDALAEVAVDVSGRPYLLYRADYPQSYAGAFDLSLIREFLLGLANRAAINVHALCRYGDNGHHMAESLFKAAGIAIKQAYTPLSAGMGSRSTKGTL